MTDAHERIWAGVLTDEYRGMTGTRIRVWGDDPRVGTDDPAIEYVRADLVAALEDENQLMKELICWAYDTLKEINPSNYNHDDVCALNDASVEVILGLASIANGEPAMADFTDVPDLASDLSAIAMHIIKSSDPDIHGKLQEAFAAALAPLEAENQRLREALDPDNLAQIIRAVDGGNRLGAGALAEAISAALVITEIDNE